MSRPASIKPQIDLEELDSGRLLDDLRTLARFGSASSTGINRIAYSETDLQARAWIDETMAELGMDVRRDAVGNSIGTYHGADLSLPPIAVGSHTDTVPNGGSYDGALGVIAAIACVRTLHDSQVRLHHPIEVINFAAEESTMGGGCVGSRAMAGLLTPGELQLDALDGKPVESHLRRAGLEPREYESAARKRGAITCYLEYHIEQNSVLDEAAIPLGIVDSISGVRRFDVRFGGIPDHAARPMNQRSDALVTASTYVLAVRDTAIHHNVIGTVGTVRVHPGSPNAVPGDVVLSGDIRSHSESELAGAVEKLRQVADGLGGQFTLVSSRPAVKSAPRLVGLLRQALEGANAPYRVVSSGGGHDARPMASITDHAMLFVRSIGGVSHSPDEFTEPEDSTLGAKVLLATVCAADSEYLADPSTTHGYADARTQPEPTDS